MQVHRRNLIVLCLTIFLAAAGWNQIIPLLPDFLALLLAWGARQEVAMADRARSA